MIEGCVCAVSSSVKACEQSYCITYSKLRFWYLNVY